MLEHPIPLQIDLFTREQVDRRTPEQKRLDERRANRIPTQTEMFAQRDLAQFGVRAHPLMPLSPGKLHLIAEDPRSEEEIERALEQAAQALTSPMFGQAEALPSETHQPLATHDAADDDVPLAPTQPSVGDGNCELPLPVVLRVPRPAAFPLLTLTRQDLLQRRPDLKPQIEGLDDDELGFLAEKVGEALREPYALLLGMVLALYLDPELQLRLVAKHERSQPIPF